MGPGRNLQARSSRPRRGRWGLTLRVLRRQDGTLELDDLIHAPADSSAASNRGPGRARARWPRLRPADPGRQRSDPDGGATGTASNSATSRAGPWEGTRATIQELRGALNGGTFEVVAQLDRSAATPPHSRATSAPRGSSSNEPWAPSSPSLAHDRRGGAGTLNINLYLRGQGTSRAELRRTVVGHGTGHLDPIGLDGSAIPHRAGLLRRVAIPGASRVGQEQLPVQKDDRQRTSHSTSPRCRSCSPGRGPGRDDGDSFHPAPSKAARPPRRPVDRRRGAVSALKVEGPLNAPDHVSGRCPREPAPGRSRKIGPGTRSRRRSSAASRAGTPAPRPCLALSSAGFDAA